MYKNRKPLIIGVLCALIVVMAVGFALLSQNLTISGTSSIDSNWNIRITSISASPAGSAEDKVASGDCTTRTIGGCNSTTASFNAGLTTPGDSITYTVTVTNSGTLDGVVSSINLTCSENSAIQCTMSGLTRGDTITKNGGTNTVNVVVTYNPATESQPANTNSTATLTINYQQDLGQVTPPAPTYATYSIGDTVTYKNATWRVIKNSPSNENYVTLMKETVLTANELGNYAYEYTCVEDDGTDGCTTEGQKIKYDGMSYYWSSTCHYSGTFGNDTYNSEDTSGCSGHNDYAGSKVKLALESYATANNMMNDLAEVSLDGTNYKIRLITKDELLANLGYDEDHKSAGNYTRTDNVPTWVYSNFGEEQNSVYEYWTMTPYADSASRVWGVNSDGYLGRDDVVGDSGGVRPVINLLKPAN